MSLESAIADLVSASTQLTQSVNVTRATVEATRDSVIAQEAPVTAAKDATVASATAATTDAATTASKLTTAAADYATQKTTKGLAAVQTSADTELKDRLHRRDPARHPFRGARPSLVMDFVRQECHRNNAAGNLEQVDLSSFMTFTRGSTATYVGPDGLIKTAGVNEARYGYDPVTGEALGLLIEEQRTNLAQRSNAVLPYFGIWGTTDATCLGNAAIAPDGTLSASKFIASTVNTNHIINFGISGLTGTFTWSIYAKPAGYNYISLRELGTTGNGACFNLSAGTVGVTVGSCTPTITPAGNGWYRCTITVTLANQTFGCSVFSGTTNVYTETHAGDGISGAYLWGAQLEAGSFPTSYIPTPATFTGRASTKTYFDSNGVLQTAASGVAVTDYGYVDGRWVSKGLSLEGQATNLLTQSQSFTGCGVSYVSLAGAKITAPDGTTSGVPLTPTFGATLNSYTTQLSFGTFDGAQKTFSLFVKANGLDRVRLRMVDNTTSASAHAIINLTDGSYYGTIADNASWSGVKSTITPLPNGWFRITLTGTGIGGGTVTAGVLPYDSVITTGDGVKGLYIWGAQLETGPIATSYIPTTTAQVTRAADTSTSAQVTRAADDATQNLFGTWGNPYAGTLLAAARLVRANSSANYTQKLISINTDAGASSYRLELGSFGGGRVYGFTSLSSIGNVYSAAAPLPVAGSTFNGGLSYSRDKYSFSFMGTAVQTNGAMSRIFKPVYFSIGYLFNGYIRQLTYFPRQLSDADLQALTILED